MDVFDDPVLREIGARAGSYDSTSEAFLEEARRTLLARGQRIEELQRAQQALREAYIEAALGEMNRADAERDRRLTVEHELAQLRAANA